MWLNWEIGAELFEELLVDYDWAISAGNYMWVCSTAFEGLLNSSKLIDPVLYGKRLEPSGDYIRRYVPELEKFEFEYIHEPWKAPLHVQEAANCIIGSFTSFYKQMVFFKYKYLAQGVITLNVW